MTLAIDKMDGRDHIKTAHRERLPKKTKVTWYQRCGWVSKLSVNLQLFSYLITTDYITLKMTLPAI